MRSALGVLTPSVSVSVLPGGGVKKKKGKGKNNGINKMTDVLHWLPAEG